MTGDRRHRAAEVYLGKTGSKSPLDILPFEGDKLPRSAKEAK